MTEASHQMASNPLPPAARKAGSVGPGTGVRIGIRDEQGGEVPRGKAGEVCIDGPGVIREYENNPEATAKSFFGEWFRTGDQGILDEDGYLHLTGRIKELIIRAGENIAPREIDEVLLAHPAVAEAVCFGVPHPTWGEEVEAAVVLRPETPAGEADLIALLPRPAGRFQVSQEDPHRGLDSAHRDGQDPAAERGGGAGRAVQMKFVIAGAGAVGAYMGARPWRAPGWT